MAVPDTIARPAETPAAPRPGRWLPSRRLRVTFSRFTAGSVVSTVASQATLTGVFWLGGVSATTASVLAFVAGAIPNFLINWKWTWGRQGRPSLIRELLPYLAIVIGGGFAATALTTIADHLVAPLLIDRGWRTLVLDLVYLGSYGLLVVVKFALLDRLMAPRRDATGRSADASRTPEPMFRA